MPPTSTTSESAAIAPTFPSTEAITRARPAGQPPSWRSSIAGCTNPPAGCTHAAAWRAQGGRPGGRRPIRRQLSAGGDEWCESRALPRCPTPSWLADGEPSAERRNVARSRNDVARRAPPRAVLLAAERLAHRAFVRRDAAGDRVDRRPIEHPRGPSGRPPDLPDAVRDADRDRQRIGRVIGRRPRRHPEHDRDHPRNLFLVGGAVPGDRALHLVRR